MPSQEDYLDNLLKDMGLESSTTEEPSGFNEEMDKTEQVLREEESLEQAFEAYGEEEPLEQAFEAYGEEKLDSNEALYVEEPQSPSYIDDVADMTEEEIETLLNASMQAEETTRVEWEDIPEESLLDGEDSDLLEIHDMLQKSDNNEPIDVAATGFLNEEDESGPVAELLAGIEGRIEQEDIHDNSQLRMQAKERKREEKAAKKAARETAKAAKKAAREEAKAAKKTEKRAKAEATSDLDIALLDSIVSAAGRMGEETEDHVVNSTNSLAEEDTPIDGLLADGESTFADDLHEDLDSSLGSEMNLDAESDVESDTESDAEPDAESDIESLSMLLGNQSDDEAALAEGSEVASDESTGKEKKGKKQKNKKQKNGKGEGESEEASEGKLGLLGRILNFLLEEEDEEEEEGNENIRLSDENQNIINELDDKKGKKKKGKKADKKAEKNANKSAKAEKKPPKPKKAKKPKKEKPMDLENIMSNGPKLTFQKVLPVLLLGITVGAAIFILSGVSVDTADKRAAKEAFKEKDYETCFQNLFGKELNEEEKIMYGTSESILYIRLWYNEYLMFAKAGQELEALDSLIQTVNDYPMLYEYATLWNATGQIQEVYAQVLNILKGRYGLSEMQAMEIADIRSDEDYTREVVEAVKGKYLNISNEFVDILPVEDKLEDELPEETGMEQGDFVDNR